MIIPIPPISDMTIIVTYTDIIKHLDINLKKVIQKVKI